MTEHTRAPTMVLPDAKETGDLGEEGTKKHVSRASYMDIRCLKEKERKRRSMGPTSLPKLLKDRK